MTRSHSAPNPLRRLLGAQLAAPEPAAVSFGGRLGYLWVVVIGLNFFLLSNPATLLVTQSSLRIAGAVTLLAVLLTPRSRVPVPPISVVLLLCLGLLSMAWSWFPRLTLDFTSIYFGVAIIAIAIATSVEARTIARGAMLGGVLIVATSFITLWASYPGVEIPPGSSGILAGVGGNRNILAYSLTIPLSLCLSWFPSRLPERVCWVLGVGVISLGILAAGSGTGYFLAIALVVAAVLLAANDRWRRDGARSSTLRTVGKGAAAIAVIAMMLNLVARLLDRDFLTLSGRVSFWQATWEATDGWSRWFGAGWGSVWPHPWYPAPTNEAYQDIVARTVVPPTHGHSSLFDILPELGFLGIFLAALVHGQAISRAVAMQIGQGAGSRPSRSESSRMVLLGTMAVLLFGITEPIDVLPLGWFMIVMMASGFSSPVQSEARVPTQAPPPTAHSQTGPANDVQ